MIGSKAAAIAPMTAHQANRQQTTQHQVTAAQMTQHRAIRQQMTQQVMIVNQAQVMTLAEAVTLIPDLI